VANPFSGRGRFAPAPIPQFEGSLIKHEDKSRLECSICKRRLPVTYLVDDRAHTGSFDTSLFGLKFFEADGVSSKISTLAANIERDLSNRKRYVE
jgi:hypothetical protein